MRDVTKIMPGCEFPVNYAGRSYQAKLTGRYRIRTGGRRAWGWQLVGDARFTTGSGRTHAAEVVLASYLNGEPATLEAASAVVRALAAAGQPIALPKRGKDEYYSAEKALREGRREWKAQQAAQAPQVQARSVTTTDEWGVKRVVGGFGDVGGPG
jgi:hypothetical protein